MDLDHNKGANLFCYFMTENVSLIVCTFIDGGTVILDEEPDVGSGMGAALKLAMSKGYLEKEEKKRVVLSKAAQELQAQRYSIEDKAAYVFSPFPFFFNFFYDNKFQFLKIQ